MPTTTVNDGRVVDPADLLLPAQALSADRLFVGRDPNGRWTPADTFLLYLLFAAGADAALDPASALPGTAGYLAVDPETGRCYVVDPAYLGGGGGAWGSIVGTLSSQTDLAAALALKAALASPALTGTPTAPTAAPGTNTTQLATAAFVKAAVDLAVTGLFDLKGSTDASTNPNFPAASKGDAYVVTVAGKIGGSAGQPVDVGDVYVATADNAGGTEGSVGTSWCVLEHNLQGALLAANNLSDLTSAPTARTNLGLAAVAASGSATDLATGTLPDARLSAVGTADTYSNLTAITTDVHGRVTAVTGTTAGPALPSIATGLYGYWPLSEAVGKKRWASQAVPPFNEVGSVPRATGAAYGPEADFNNDDAIYLRHSPEPSGFKLGGGGTDWTVAVTINRRTGSGQQTLLETGSWWLLDFDGPWFVPNVGGVMQTGLPQGSAPVVGTPTPVVIRYNATTRLVRIKVGATAEVSGTVPGIIDADSGYLYMGHSAVHTGTPLIAKLSHLAFWRRELSDSERDQYLANPRYPFDASPTDQITVSEPRPRQVLPMTAHRVADVPVTGRYTGPTTPTTVEYEIDYSGVWHTLDAAPANGLFTGTIRGLPARDKRYTVRVRFSNATGVTGTVGSVGVGYVLLGIGQSNMAGHGLNAQAYTPSATAVASMSRVDNGVLDLADPSQASVPETAGQPGSYLVHVAGELLARTGLPVMVLNRAVGGTVISSWQAGQPNYTMAVADTLYFGPPHLVLWHQGESDAQAGMDTATYQGYLSSLAGNVLADLGCKLASVRLQTFSAATGPQQAAIRTAVDNLVTAGTIKAGGDLSGLNADDAYHLQSDSNLRAAGAIVGTAVAAALPY